MPHYVYLARWTSQATKELKDSANRAESFSKDIIGAGGKVVSYLHTMGPHDAVVVADLPTDEAANVVAMKVAMRGNLTTLTLKGWTGPEYAEMIKKL